MEKDLDKAVMKLIEDHGGWSIKYWAGSKFTKNGIPDILACIDGYFFGIEDKAENGQPKLLQLKNLEWIRQAGGYGILLYPDQFENFKKFIGEYFDPYSMSNECYDWYIKNLALQERWRIKLEKM